MLQKSSQFLYVLKADRTSFTKCAFHAEPHDFQEADPWLYGRVNDKTLKRIFKYAAIELIEKGSFICDVE